ncbi:MAG: IS3 family transposase [Alphaproteobacteria bacterium]|nr:IS3 family transposase [Alphaproteobacteria bacterium]
MALLELGDVVDHRDFPRFDAPTLKEQIIYGRIYRNLAELREAVCEFVERYNNHWLVEKNGYLSLKQAHTAWHQKNLPIAA